MFYSLDRNSKEIELSLLYGSFEAIYKLLLMKIIKMFSYQDKTEFFS